MSLRHMFQPRSVAVVGSIDVRRSVAAIVADNLIRGGFAGEVIFINHSQRAPAGFTAFRHPSALTAAPDLAIVAVAPESAAEVLDALGRAGTPAALVVSTGFVHWEPERLQVFWHELRNAAGGHRMRILGPNSLGLMVSRIHLNAGFAHLQPLPGRLAFVTQSNSVLASVLDWATARRIGFSHCVCLGDMIDVDFGEMLDYLAADVHSRAILLYMEQIRHARRFMSAARAAARIKPVIVVKAGCSAALACGKEATKGRGMLDEDAVYDAAFARAGMLRVKDLKALFDSTATLSLMQPIHGNRLAVITNGRGIGLLAVSTLREKGGRLAELSETTLERLRAFLPCAGLQHILLDIRPDADGRRYAAALDALLGDSALDGVLVLNAPHAGIARLEIAEAVIATVEKNADPWRTCGVLACWLGDGSAQAARQRFTEAGIPNYDTPDEAVRGFMQMFRYRHSQEMLLETPPSIPEDFRPDLQAARAVLTEAFEKGRSWLDGPEALELIRSYGMPVVASCRAVDPAAAGQAACRLEGPVTVQLLRSDGRAVTEPGSVVRNLDDPVLVAETAAAMAEEFEETSPAAARRGFLVRKTVDRRGRHELFAAMIEDPVFGPLICFGQGGEVGEATGDRALALPPLNLKLARELIQSTRVIRVPGGSTAAASVDAAALALCLVKLSQLVCDLPEVAEVTIDPLLAGSDGVVAEEAFIRIRPPAGAVDRRMAVCPYPKELEEALRLPDGRTLMLRPIRPEDEPAFQQLFAGLSPEAVRFRFLHPMKVLPHREAARLTQIDYDREMALVLATGSASGAPELCGSVRITADADNREAEFAILLRDDMTGMGLGPMLMRRIIDYGRRRGILRIHGDVLDDNRSMLRICRALGFRQQRDPDDPGIIKVTLNLQPL